MASNYGLDQAPERGKQESRPEEGGSGIDETSPEETVCWYRPLETVRKEGEFTLKPIGPFLSGLEKRGLDTKWEKLLPIRMILPQRRQAHKDVGPHEDRIG